MFPAIPLNRFAWQNIVCEQISAHGRQKDPAIDVTHQAYGRNNRSSAHHGDKLIFKDLYMKRPTKDKDVLF